MILEKGDRVKVFDREWVDIGSSAKWVYTESGYGFFQQFVNRDGVIDALIIVGDSLYLKEIECIKITKSIESWVV